MANFMDKVKQSYESTVKGAFKQPHELSEVERVVENMAQVEVEIQSKFVQLGQLFYKNNVNPQGLDEEYGTLVNDINKLNENRKGFYAHKLRLEGNMMCVNCGEIIPYGCVYCSNCGKKASQKEE